MNYKLLILLIPPIILLSLIIIHVIRRSIIIQKINKLSTEEKCKRLNTLIYPFGYFYDHCKDTFHTTLDAWQRDFGYGQIFDKAAPHFNMIFDALPVYFDYDGRTWLIEFWKGQYGINIGAEVGIYKSDRILGKDEYDNEFFTPVSDKQLFPICMHLYHNDEVLGCICKHHWWLTTFKMGRIAKPKNVAMEVALTFPDYEMLDAFIDALAEHPLAPENIHGNGLNLSFLFDSCSTCHGNFFRKLYSSWVMLKNRFLCKLFTWATVPFTNSMDRILYLYEYAPFTLRKLINIHSKKFYKNSRRK